MSNLPNRLLHALSSGRYKLNINRDRLNGRLDRQAAAELLIEARAFNRRSTHNKSWSRTLYLAGNFALQMRDEVESREAKERYEFLFRLMDSTSCLNDLYR